MPKIKHARHINGHSVTPKEFQRAIVKSIQNGNVWPAEIADSIGWNKMKQDRTVVIGEMNQLIRLGLIAPPAGYSVTAKGMAFAAIEPPQEPVADRQAIPVPQRPAAPSQAPSRAAGEDAVRSTYLSRSAPHIPAQPISIPSVGNGGREPPVRPSRRF
jgi:hypothetical protein